MDDAIIQELTDSELEPFMPLLGEIECGRHFSASDPKHVSWLKHKIASHVACGVRYFGCRSRTEDIFGIVGILIERKLFCAPSAEIVDIGVVEAHRRCGLGTELLMHAVKLAGENGVHNVFVRTYAADTVTIAFYGHNAFYPVAVIPGTNGFADEGDIVMRKRLSNSLGAGEGK